ncbi:MAG: cytochrome P450, partial [Deltaproteobacteria bacterium]
AYGSEMLAVTDDALARWPLAEAFPVHRSMQSVTLDIILRTVFGMRDPSEREPFMRAITELLDLGAWPPLLIPAMQRDLGRWSPWGRFLRARERGDAMLYESIRRRRAEGIEGRNDILSLLLAARDESGQPLSDAELRDELVTLVVAGHETTATALSWALRWVLADPKLYRRLRAEVEPLAAKGPLVPEQVQKLELLDATVKESLRLVPVVMMVGRFVQHPIRLGGHDLPTQTFVAPNIVLAHRRDPAFPHPLAFDPDRFVGARTSPFEWFPFGGGVRRCIGASFAVHEMKMVLATLFARTTLRLAPHQRLGPVRRAITMTPAGGVRVIVDVRSAQTTPVAA